MKRLILIGACLILFASPAFLEEVSMNLSSPDFAQNSLMPAKFTCLGLGVNPSLLIEGAPGSTKSLVLIMDDPDAPRQTFIHWIVYNIPPVSNKIDEDSVPGIEGVNTTGATAYVPPCPPTGTHRYFFKVYALDSELNFNSPPEKGAIEAAMQGHILGKAELVGLFKK